MSLALKVHASVADAATGRLRGKVRKVLEAPEKRTGFEGRFLVEWETGVRSVVDGADLVARFGSFSEGWRAF